MPTNDIKESALAQQTLTAKRIKDVREQKIMLTNYERQLCDTFIINAEGYGLEDEVVEGLKMIETTEPQKVTLSDIKAQFSGEDLDRILDNIMFTAIDYKETKENLKYSGGLQDAIVNSIMERLESISKIKVKKVV